jgi:hypothetical protein
MQSANGIGIVQWRSKDRAILFTRKIEAFLLFIFSLVPNRTTDRIYCAEPASCSLEMTVTNVLYRKAPVSAAKVFETDPLKSGGFVMVTLEMTTAG